MDTGGLSFGVLGALELYRDGRPIPLPSGRQRAVLAALLVRANRPVEADQLVEAAWAGGLPADPRAVLHTVVSRLRGTFGGRQVLRSVPTGYVLEAAPDAVDAARFESLRARAAGLPPREALGLLDTALGLWRGPAYAEFSDRDFAQPEAVRLDELRLAAAEDHAGVLLELGDAEAAAVALEHLVAEHPLRERALGRLMTALYRAGRPTEALDRYRAYRGLLADQLGLDPSPDLRALEMRILGHDLQGQDLLEQDHGGRGRAAGGRPRPRPAPVPQPPVWPVPSTVFVGREEEAGALAEAVSGHRLVTVTGVGGVGKTRLVAETLAELVARVGTPATVVELAQVEAGGVDTAVAAALGVGAATHHDLRAPIVEYLSIASGLLVLDNCEHLLGAASGLTAQILRQCPGIRVLATSRHRLGLAEEQVFPLDPLPPPDGADGERAELAAAVRLFADRARRARPSFALTADTLPAVAEICRRLDGLPLAIELAATRTATLGLGPLLDRLDRSLDLLGDGRSGQPTLRAVMDWSYGLLDPDECRVFAALSVFAGGFDLDAAEHVATALVAVPVPVVVARLVDASLLQADGTGGTMRYRMLEVVRAFARARLTESGNEEAVRRAHATWALAVAEALARDVEGPADAAAYGRLEQERTELMAAVRWAMDAGAAGLAGGITGAVGRVAGPYLPDAGLLSALRQVAASAAVRETGTAAVALSAGARAAMMQGDLDAAEHLATEGLERAATTAERCLMLQDLAITDLYRGARERSAGWMREVLASDACPVTDRSNAHTTLALIACWRGELDTARAEVAAGTACAEACGAATARTFAAYAAGEIALVEDAAAAVPLLEAAAAEARRAGVIFVAGVAETALLSALTRLGRSGAALAVAGPLLQHWRQLGAWPQLWTTLRLLAELLVELERDEPAELLLAAADHAPAAPAVTDADTERVGRLRRRLHERLDTATLARLETLARTLPRAQVVERALTTVSDLTTTQETADPPDDRPLRSS